VRNNLVFLWRFESRNAQRTAIVHCGDKNCRWHGVYRL